MSVISDFFVKLKYQASTITLSVGIKYSVIDLRVTPAICVTYGKVRIFVFVNFRHFYICTVALQFWLMLA